jgi:hypothetical protein
LMLHALRVLRGRCGSPISFIYNHCAGEMSLPSYITPQGCDAMYEPLLTEVRLSSSTTTKSSAFQTKTGPSLVLRRRGRSGDGDGERRSTRGQSAASTVSAHVASRLAWVDLSAGPFDSGPFIGGRGVHAARSFPQTPSSAERKASSDSGGDGGDSGSSGSLPIRSQGSSGGGEGGIRKEALWILAEISRKLLRLRTMSEHLACRCNGSGDTAGGSASDCGSDPVCVVLQAHIKVLHTLTAAEPKLARYESGIAVRQRELGAGNELYRLNLDDFHGGFLYLLGRAFSATSSSSSSSFSSSSSSSSSSSALTFVSSASVQQQQVNVGDSSGHGEGAGLTTMAMFGVDARTWSSISRRGSLKLSGAEESYLSQLTTVLRSLISHAFSPPCGGSMPVLVPTTNWTTSVAPSAPRWLHSLHLRWESAFSNSDFQEQQDCLWPQLPSSPLPFSSLARSFVNAHSVDIYVMRTHNRYDPLDITTGGE